ncbi:MAG: FG-GAP-like repeat-containing protein [Vicinamibacterales bacterium]
MGTLRSFVAGAFTLALLLASPAPSMAQEDTGDLFGDLFEILRDPATGQPILQQRTIELPGDVIGTGYCPVPINAAGEEIPFADLSCEVHPDYLDQVIEVDYFGRLSSARTRERNQRMHFDEVIAYIKIAEVVDQDAAGRLILGTDCDPGGTCVNWKTIDSPLENMAMYLRVLKYGHIQTDPLEEDTSPGGDPSEGTVYHPALDADDWAKFRGVTLNLLPRSDANQCFTGPDPANFVAECADPQALAMPDFILASSFLGGAADKTGKITVDLVQYLNRFLKIPVATPMTEAPVDTLPALIRDESGVITPAPDGLPAPANERFVNFAVASYLRTDWFNESVLVLQTSDGGLTYRPMDVELLQWLLFANGPLPDTLNVMPAFVAASSDALRVVEFMHEYEVPANLWGTGAAATHTGPHGLTVRYRATNQNMMLTATVNAATPVNGGTVSFSVRTADGTDVGTLVTSGPVVDGAASAAYELPGGTAPQALVIVAVYSGTTGLAGSTGTGTLLIGQADTTTTVDVATVPVPMVPTVVPLTARVNWADTVPIAEGTVEFMVTDAAGTPVGAPVAAAVAGGIATVDFLVPALPAQRLSTSATFSGTPNLLGSNGHNALAVGCLAVTVLPVTLPPANVDQPFAVAFTTDGVAPVALSVTGTLPAGLTFTGSALSGTPLAGGTYDFTVSATDAAGCAGSRAYSLVVNSSLNALAVGPGAGVPGVVRHFEPNGTQTQGGEYAPFTTAWTGGVRVARGDITRDGVPDTIVGTGPGGQALIRAYNGTSQGLIGTLVAFEPTYTGGVNVAVGDITGDGVVDVIAGAASGTPRVRIFNGASGALMFDFVPFTTAGMSGVEVAAGDVNGDGLADLIVGSGAGAEPRVRVYNAANAAVLHDFLAYPAAFLGGVFVAAGDVDADGRADIVTGPGSGGGPLVKAFSGVSGAEIRSFFAGDPTFVGGVRVAAADVNTDGHAEIIVAAGPGAPPFVKIFHGATSAELRSFLVYPPEATMGVFVAAPVRALAPAPVQ